jgi:mono/diheme cytochrome c family protein
MNLLPLAGVWCRAVVLAAAFGIPATVAAQDFDPGRALYENHCQGCHAQWVHTREGRKVTSLGDLRERVGTWSVHAGLRWTQEEVDLVTRYVNRRYYQLTE